MVFARIAVLLFLAAYSFSMNGIGPLNAFGKIAAVSFFVWAPCLYFLPIYEAYSRDHEKLTAIAVINVLLGWTVLGWIVALVWAVSQQRKGPQQPQAAQRPCPFCAEPIQIAAIKCKHCGSDLTGRDAQGQAMT